MVAAWAAWGSGPRGPASVYVGSARSVAAGSSVLASGSAAASMLWPCTASAAIFGGQTARFSFLEVLCVALIEVGAAPPVLPPKGVR